MSKPNNLSGQTFGKLRALVKFRKETGGQLYWLCRCECGELAPVQPRHLMNGDTKSCGCLSRGRGIIIQKLKDDDFFQSRSDMLIRR